MQLYKGDSASPPRALLIFLILLQVAPNFLEIKEKLSLNDLT